jgi:hypothetical protein
VSIRIYGHQDLESFGYLSVFLRSQDENGTIRTDQMSDSWNINKTAVENGVRARRMGESDAANISDGYAKASCNRVGLEARELALEQVKNSVEQI